MHEYRSITSIIKNTYQKEGIYGFYKGLKSGITTSPLFYSIYFPVYETAKTVYSQYFYNNKTTQNVKILSLSSLTGVLIADIFTTPMWVVRIRFQTKFLYDQSHSGESFNLIREISSLYKSEGFFALYRGYRVCLIGSPHIIVQFNIYEYISKLAREYENKTHTPYHFVALSSIASKCKYFVN
jgi:hypothetical protein